MRVSPYIMELWVLSYTLVGALYINSKFDESTILLIILHYIYLYRSMPSPYNEILLVVILQIFF